jgi:hypothetical protein
MQPYETAPTIWNSVVGRRTEIHDGMTQSNPEARWGAIGWAQRRKRHDDDRE